ncbi:hypothetical protein F5Y19DRAFT_348513 [Xylariaceae sp. FL1651]|nr:hypothetical protein F5Y19DRAFT_348513 [Xylariaceae sp. FL1651]
MPSEPRSPPVARCFAVATLFVLVFLAAVSISNGYTAHSLQKHNPPPEDTRLTPSHEKRLLGLGGLVGVVPSLLGNIIPGGIASSLVAQVTADINSLLPLLNGLGAQSPDGVPLTTGGQAALPLTALPQPTGAQLGGLADKLGDLLNGIVPVAAPSIIAAITEKAHAIVSSAQAIATDVASLANQVGGDQIQAPDALDRIGGLFGSLDSKVNDIINGVTSDLASDLPLPVLQDLGQVISSGLGDIVGVANGPLSLVGDLIEQNVCGIVTPVDGILATVAGLCGNMPSAIAQVSTEVAGISLTNTDATLTGEASASTIFPASPSISGDTIPLVTSMSSPPNSQGQATSTGQTDSSAPSPNPSLNSAASSLSSTPPLVTQPSPAGGGAGSGSLSSSTQSPSSQSLAGFSTPGSSGGVPPTIMTPLTSGSSLAHPGGGGTLVTTATEVNGTATVTEYITTTEACTSTLLQTDSL